MPKDISEIEFSFNRPGIPYREIAGEVEAKLKRILYIPGSLTTDRSLLRNFEVIKETDFVQVFKIPFDLVVTFHQTFHQLGVVGAFRDITTNERVASRIYNNIEQARFLIRELDRDVISTIELAQTDINIQVFRKSLEGKSEAIRRSIFLNLRTLGFIYQKGTEFLIDINKLRRFIHTQTYNIPLDIVAKRIKGKDTAKRELNYYILDAELGVNNVTAITDVFIEKENDCSTSFTVFEDIESLLNVDDIFNQRNDYSIFRDLMENLAKKHSKGLLHGDLNLGNIGLEIRNGRRTIILDYVRGSQVSTDKTNEYIQALSHELFILSNALKNKFNISQLTQEDVLHCQKSLENYIQTIVERIIWANAPNQELLRLRMEATIKLQFSFLYKF